MSVSKEDVEQVADNARLDVGDIDQMRKEMENVLKIFDSLSKIDTEDVEPAFHPIEVEPEAREDEEEDTLDKEQVFRNTSNEEDGYFKGPSV